MSNQIQWNYTVLDASSEALGQQIAATEKTLVERTNDASRQFHQLTQERKTLQTCFDNTSSSMRQVKAIQGGKIDELMNEVARLSAILEETTNEANSIEKQHDAYFIQRADLESPTGIERRYAIFLQKFSGEPGFARAFMHHRGFYI